MIIMYLLFITNMIVFFTKTIQVTEVSKQSNWVSYQIQSFKSRYEASIQLFGASLVEVVPYY